VKAKVVALSETGSDSTQIRSYIINAYNTWSIQPEYLLLVGDKYQIPFPYYYHPYSIISFSDNYYANVTGDFHNELYHGRLWVSDTTQVQTVVAKILGYEKNPCLTDSLWFRKGVTIVNEYEQGQPPSDSLYWEDARYAMQWMLNAGYVHIDSFSFVLGHDSSDVIDAINDGRTYILYRGIGFNDWLWPFQGINPAQMNNGFKMPVVLSATCATIEGIGRNWLVAGNPNQPKGVVGFFGTTTSLYAAAEMRSALCRGTTASLFGDTLGNLGKAAEAGRLQYYAQFQDLIDYHSWTLLGDPEMIVWTDTPKELLVGHNMYFTTGICTTTVFVQHNSTPIKGALVCAMAKSDSSFYHYGYTDNSGGIQFIDTLHSPGDSVYITVTGRNLKPYHNARPVLYTGGPYVRLYSYRTLDSLGGNGDCIANPGEDIEIPIVLRNWGNTTAYGVSAVIEKKFPDSNFVLYDTIKNIGDIAPYESICIYPDGYNALIDSNCPDLHLIDLHLYISDSNKSTWLSDLDFTVHSPVLLYEDFYFNGYVQYTPTGVINEITVTLLNVGSGLATNTTGKISCHDTLMTIIDSVAVFYDILPDSLGSNEENPFIITTASGIPPCCPIDITLEVIYGACIDTFSFRVYVGQEDYIIWDPDPNHSSGPIIKSILDSLEFRGTYAADFPFGIISIYKSAFVCAGVYPYNYLIADTSLAGQQIDYYLQAQGGRVFLEGGDIWFDPLSNHGYNFGPLFRIDPMYNSIGLFQGAIGCNGTFTENMNFAYGGEATMLDYIDSTGGSQIIFNKMNSNYGCGVAAGNRTVGLSFELGGLIDTLPPSTKLALVDSIMKYFSITPTGITESKQVSVTPVLSLTCHPNPTRQMTNIRFMIQDTGPMIEQKNNRAELKIYDISGRLVKSFQLPASNLSSSNSVTWDGSDDLGRRLAQGVYFVHLQTADFKEVVKTILLH
jgi:hypothetical protein